MVRSTGRAAITGRPEHWSVNFFRSPANNETLQIVTVQPPLHPWAGLYPRLTLYVCKLLKNMSVISESANRRLLSLKNPANRSFVNPTLTGMTEPSVGQDQTLGGEKWVRGLTR